MKVLSFRAQAVDYYRRAQQSQSMVKKKITTSQWVRGHVARIDQMPGSMHVVYMTIEEFDGGFDGQRLPRGFYYAELPAVTIGDPSNQHMEFRVSEDAIGHYPVGRAIRLDAKLTNDEAIKGVIVKTSREPNALKPYWRVTVEYPAPPLAFEHYAVRSGDTINLNYDSSDRDYTLSHNSYVKPSLKSVLFRVPEGYVAGFKALYMRSKPVCVRLEDNSQDVTGYVNWIDEAARQVKVGVTAIEQDRGKSEMMMAMSRNLGVPYDILVADPPYGKSPLASVYTQCEEYLRERRNDDQVDAALWHWLKNPGDYKIHFPLTDDVNLKETDDMKIYDACVVKTDDQGAITEIVKVVPPFLAKTDRAAQDAVLVDYAAEAKLAGKDLTGIKVLVRTFQSVG